MAIAGSAPRYEQSSDYFSYLLTEAREYWRAQTGIEPPVKDISHSGSEATVSFGGGLSVTFDPLRVLRDDIDDIEHMAHVFDAPYETVLHDILGEETETMARRHFMDPEDIYCNAAITKCKYGAAALHGPAQKKSGITLHNDSNSNYITVDYRFLPRFNLSEKSVSPGTRALLRHELAHEIHRNMKPEVREAMKGTGVKDMSRAGMEALARYEQYVDTVFEWNRPAKKAAYNQWLLPEFWDSFVTDDQNIPESPHSYGELGAAIIERGFDQEMGDIERARSFTRSALVNVVDKQDLDQRIDDALRKIDNVFYGDIYDDVVDSHICSEGLDTSKFAETVALYHRGIDPLLKDEGLIGGERYLENYMDAVAAISLYDTVDIQEDLAAVEPLRDDVEWIQDKI
jgi:hypothetical protein